MEINVVYHTSYYGDYWIRATEAHPETNCYSIEWMRIKDKKRGINNIFSIGNDIILTKVNKIVTILYW